MIDFEKDAKEVIPTDQALFHLSELVQLLLDSEQRVKELEDRLKEEKNTLRTLSETRIPDKLLEMGLSQITLATGEKVTVSPFYSCTIKEENKEAAFQWLRDNNYGDIVKYAVVANFKGDEAKTLDQLREFMAKEGIPFDEKEGIHAQTLKAWAKEVSEAGIAVPDTIRIYRGSVTKIK